MLHSGPLILRHWQIILTYWHESDQVCPDFLSNLASCWERWEELRRFFLGRKSTIPNWIIGENPTEVLLPGSNGYAWRVFPSHFGRGSQLKKIFHVFFCKRHPAFSGGEIPQKYTYPKTTGNWRWFSQCKSYISSRCLDPGSWNKERVLSRQLCWTFYRGATDVDASQTPATMTKPLILRKIHTRELCSLNFMIRDMIGDLKRCWVRFT